MSNLVSDDHAMKTLPNDATSSARQRKLPSGSTSIYVPPPLRKRKNSNDFKKTSPTLPQKSKIIPGRGVSLSLNTSSTKFTNKNKKCENSYMLFGLEDMRNMPVKNTEKVSALSQNQEGKESFVNSPVIKKCDHSYLLFSSESSEVKFENSNCLGKKQNDKIAKKPLSSIKPETNELCRAITLKHTSLLSDEDSQSEVTSDEMVRVKSFDTIISPYLPEELSFELDSLSVGNKSQNFEKYSSRETLKSIRQSSQKKCDNSSFLFEDDNDDDDSSNYKSSKFHSKDKSNYSSTYSCGDNSFLSGRLDHITNFNEHKKSEQTPSLIMIPNNSIMESANKEVMDSDEISHDHSNSKSLDKMHDIQITPNLNSDMSDSIEDYVVEIYNFPKTLRTQDMMTIFSCYVQDGFVIKWVDDTHALGIFSNSFSVCDVLKKQLDLVSVRPLQSATAASIEIASTLPVPSASRPRTCPSLARRLVSGALGLKVSVSDEIRQAEKKILQEAKEERRLAAKQREEAWEGTLRSSLGT